MAKDFGGREKRYETYKTRLSASVTPEGIEGLDRLAQQFEISRSELLEQIGRGQFTIFHSDSGSELLKKPCSSRSRPTDPPCAA
jgi:hypothetical protein